MQVVMDTLIHTIDYGLVSVTQEYTKLWHLYLIKHSLRLTNAPKRKENTNEIKR